MSAINRLKNEVRQQVEMRKQAGQQAQTINELLAGLRGRAGDADRRGSLTAMDLFGEQIGRQSDSARAMANATKSALARGNMATGGDGSGRTAAQMLGVDEQLGRQIGGIEGQYGVEALRHTMGQERRGDALLGQEVGGQFNMLRRLDQLDQFNRMMALQRKQANQKMLGDMLGLAGTAGGFLIGGPAGAGLGRMLTQKLGPGETVTHALTGDSMANNYA